MRNKHEEYIVCAANHHDDGLEHTHTPKNIKTGFVLFGLRHHNCLASLSMITKDKSREEHVKLLNNCTFGFLTSDDRFVDRFEALKIAEKQNQIIQHSAGYHCKELYSEDIY